LIWETVLNVAQKEEYLFVLNASAKQDFQKDKFQFGEWLIHQKN